MRHVATGSVSWRDPWVLVAIVAGLAVRAAMLVARLGDKVPFSDALWYSAQATALNRGRAFNDLFTGEPTAEHGPLTPILLSPVSTGGGASHERALMAIYGVVGFLVLVQVARHLLAQRAARVASVLAALYPNIWMHDSILMSEALAIGLVSTTMLALLHVRERPSWWSCAAVGAAIGLGGLARSELVLLAPLCAFVVWGFTRWRTGDVEDRTTSRRPRLRPVVHGSIVIATALVVVAPWVLHNLSRFEEPTFLTTNDGTTLLGANCDETWSGGDTGSWSVLCVLGVDELADAPDASVRSRLQREMAFEHVGDNLGRLPIVTVARAARMLDLYGLSDMVDGDVGEDKFAWVVWLGIVSFWLLAPLAVVGLVRMRRDDRAIVLPPLIVVVVTTLVFYGANRIRAPLEPALVLGAAAGIDVVLSALHRRPSTGGELGAHPAST